MSSMAKSTRAAMKAKAARRGSSKGSGKVDASDWSPSEPLNTETKTGMRPISRRAFKKGGKVVEKCEGGPAPMRADRAQRKSGGGIGTAIINRDEKSANKEREGGKAHVGGYKRGGDVEQDKKLVKKAIAQHDKNMHGGKSEDIKLKKGGRARKADGGETRYEDWKNYRDYKGPANGTGDKTSGPGGSQMPSTVTVIRGDKATEQPVRKNKGGAARFGGTRPTGGRMPKADGGDAARPPVRRIAPGVSGLSGSPGQGSLIKYKSDLVDDYKPPVTTLDAPPGKGPAGSYNGPWGKKRGGRTERKAGGRTKGKTNIVISINAGKPDQQAMMPKMPTPPPMPVPPVAPPPMGAGAPPMPMPAAPPPGLAGGAPGGMPPGMPPLPRKRGGRAYRSFKDMDAGAMSGMGRLEKTEIAARKPRLSGGRARSYKDMDAGAMSGMGRIEKTAIAKK